MMRSDHRSRARSTSILLIAAFAISIAGCASIEGAETDADDPVLAQLDTSRSCFNQREIRGYSRAPDVFGARERVYLDTGVNERFVLEAIGACPDLDFSLRLRLDTRTLGNVCTGDLATLVIPSTFAQELRQCPVRVLGRVLEDDR